jgi:hypothetical protein
MEDLSGFIQKWEEILNNDEELQLRNRDKASTLEGKVAVQLNIKGVGEYSISIKDGKFSIVKGPAQNPLLLWDVPIALLQEVLLNKQPVFYGLLDERGKLLFDTPNFTHFNGASIIEILYLAQGVVKSDATIHQCIEQLGGQG